MTKFTQRTPAEDVRDLGDINTFFFEEDGGKLIS